MDNAHLLAPHPDWRVYTQHALKIAVRFTHRGDAPRPMLELRHAKTGRTETKDGAPRTFAPGETRWIVVEPCDPAAPAYRLDDGAPGSAVYSKPEKDAVAHWVDVTDERAARLADLRDGHGLEVPTALLARTMRALGMRDVADEGPALLDDPRVHVFRSRTRVLGRVVATETATLRLASRDEDLAPGDLLVVELTKEGPLAVASPLLVRRIDAPAVRGALWRPDETRSSDEVAALVAAAGRAAAPPPPAGKAAAGHAWSRAVARCLGA